MGKMFSILVVLLWLNRLPGPPVGQMSGFLYYYFPTKNDVLFPLIDQRKPGFY